MTNRTAMLLLSVTLSCGGGRAGAAPTEVATAQLRVGAIPMIGPMHLTGTATAALDQPPHPAVPGAGQALRGGAKHVVRLGMSSSLSGPNQYMGQRVHRGILAALAEANKSSTRFHFELLALDDGYSPIRCIENTRRLLADDSVLALIGYVGTPTSLVAASLAEEHKTLLFGPITGAGILRNGAELEYVVNIRASYEQEIEQCIAFLISQQQIPANRIGFLTQRDGYGTAVFSAGLECLNHYTALNAYDIPHGEYERGTTAVESALVDILKHPAHCEAVILGCTAPAAAHFIRTARSHGLEGWIACLSFTAADSLVGNLADAYGPILTSQVVPSAEAESQLAKCYREAYRQSYPGNSYSPASFEGYVVGRTMTAAIESDPATPTRVSIVRTLKSRPDWNQKTCTLDASIETWPGEPGPVWLTQLFSDGLHRVPARQELTGRHQ